MPRDDLASRLDRLAAPADPPPPPDAFLGRVTRRRWARRARIAVPAAAALLLVGLVAFELLRQGTIVDGGRPLVQPAPPVAVTPRPDSLAALRAWDGRTELAPAHASSSLHASGPREPTLRALDGYRGPAAARGAEEPR